MTEIDPIDVDWKRIRRALDLPVMSGLDAIQMVCSGVLLVLVGLHPWSGSWLDWTMVVGGSAILVAAVGFYLRRRSNTRERAECAAIVARLRDIP